MDTSTQTETMMALRAHERGGVEVLTYEEAPKPVPGPGEILVAIDAASLTFTELTWDETWERDGKSRVPVIPSHEFAGVVDGLGDGVTTWNVGDKVFGLIPFDHDGAAAEYLTIDASIVARSPKSISSVEVAALSLAALTAWQGLFDYSQLERGQRVLVQGGAGGVGVFAIQLAHHSGAEVTATSRKRDHEFLRELGADVVIDFETESFEDHGPFDVVFDAVGGPVPDSFMTAVLAGGSLVTLSDPPSSDRAAELGISAYFFIVSPDAADLSEIAKLVDSGDLRVAVAAEYPLAEGRAAYASGTGSNRAPGKTVIRVR